MNAVPTMADATNFDEAEHVFADDLDIVEEEAPDWDAIARRLGYVNYKDLHKRCEGIIRSQASKFAKKDAALMADLESQIAEKVLRGLSRFRGDSELTTWVHAVGFNACCTYVGKLKRQLAGGAVVFESSVMQESDSNESSIADWGTSGSAHSPELYLIAKETEQAIERSTRSVQNSRREAGVAALIDLEGIYALEKLIEEGGHRLKSISAEFIAEVLLSDLKLSRDVRNSQAQSLTQLLGGAGNTARLTDNLLIALSREYKFALDLSCAQVAKLMGLSPASVRLNKSRGTMAIIEKGTPTHYAEIQAYRKSKRAKNAGTKVSADADDQDELEKELAAELCEA